MAVVGFLITPTYPVRDRLDFTLRYTSYAQLLSRYLLVQGRIDSVSTYIHVVYVPVSP